MRKALNLPLSSKDTFEVQIANGALIKTKGVSYEVPLKVQGHIFKVDLNILPLGDCAVVLGTQWLYSLGLIQWDFKHLTMQFWHEGISVLLKGLQPSRPSLQEGEKFLTRTVKKGLLLQIVATPPTASTVQPHPVLAQLLQNSNKVFEVPTSLPPLRNHEHSITLKEGSQPICERPYRYPFYQKSEIEKIVKELLDARSIRASQSPFSSLVLLVRKADGSWRMCIDYRSLNKATIKDKYPILVVDELLDELCGATIFSKQNLRSGYHQIRMNEHDIPKTTFRTHEGHYEFLVMPFGLTNAPSTFQSLMNDIFKPFLRKFVLVFFDDILVFSKTLDEHVSHLQLVLEVLLKNQLFAKMSKCVFGCNEVEYLRHLISGEGVRTDPKKTEAM